jgi:hypothetical protein
LRGGLHRVRQQGGDARSVVTTNRRINDATPTGANDKAAIMRDANRQRRQMARHGWSWSRCLAFSWSKAKAMRARLHADPDRPTRAMVRPTAEGVAALYTNITGRNVSAEDMARLADRLASLKN